MSEKEEMVVPRAWSYVHRSADEFLDNTDDQNTSKKYYTRIIKQRVYSKRVCYLMRDEVAIERCEFRVNSAIVYDGRSNDKLRAIKTDFHINDALYTRVEDDEQMKEYLILVGDDRIMFWKVETGDSAVISVPFRIDQVFSSEFGIIIERARIMGEEHMGEAISTIYSLVHPFSEILPVLYKDCYGEDTWYAFSNKKLTLIPSKYDNTGKYFLGYDTEKEKHYLFALRKCTAAEKSEASKVLSGSFVLPSESPNNSFTTSFSHMRSAVLGSNRSTPTRSAGRNNRNTETPLRRSIRNRAKPLTAKTPIGDLNASYASSVFSTRSQERSMLRNIRHTFRVFDLDGEETDELNVDYMFDCIWFESSDLPMDVTPQNYGTPKNITPKSILARRDTPATPISTYPKEITPTRSVKFIEKESEENMLPSPLMHKRPPPVTPVRPVSFKNEISSKNPSLKKSEEKFDFKNFNNYSNERLLAVLDELIKRHRNRILQSTFPKNAQKESSRKEQPIAIKDYVKARKNIMKYYTRLMQKGIRNGNKSVKAFYALLLYRKELWQIVRNEVRARASEYINTRAASRFFMTTDMSGQKYICFLPSNESMMTMLKLNVEKDTLVAASSLKAFDAINIPGNNMLAVLNNSTVTLFTGNYLIGTMLTKPFRHSSHELLQFIESYDKSIIIKAQHKKRLFVQNVLFDLNLMSSSQIKKLFETIFSTLPIEKAVKFYSTWYSLNRLDSLHNSISCRKSFLLELPLMIEHFFTSIGLQVTGLTCMELIRELRQSGSTPKVKRNRKQLDSDDDDFDESEEPMEVGDEVKIPTSYNSFELLKQSIQERRKIVISEAEGKENYVGSHAFALFQSFHRFFESLNIFLNGKKYKPILLEPLYVFSKVLGLQQYIQHYSLYLPALSDLIIEVEEGTVLPSSDEATAFNAEPMVSYNLFLAQFKSRHLTDPPLIPDNPHWPIRILFCAMVASGKINGMSHVRQCLGPHWQKRLNLLPPEEKALNSIIISQRTDNNTKCSRCIKLFGLSLGDIHILEPSLSSIFTQLMTELVKRLEKEASRRKLRSFPSEEEQKRWMQLQWPTDIRSNNVTQMLDFSRQILIPVRRSDDDTINREQYNLFLVSTYSKQVSKSFGRAAIGFHTTRATKMSSMSIPKIELNGRVPPNHVFHEFPNGEVTKPMNDWADFMAGASFTLSLGYQDSEEIPFARLRQWQTTHRSSAVSAGSIFAYGLAGQFKYVNIHEIHQMLIKFKKPYEIAAVLLGGAVTYRGTADMLFFRAIATHFPAFIEPTLVELKFDPIVQIASVLGIGFLFQGNSNPSITNRITNEMAKETFFEGENESHRYAYVLSCGITVGLINLSRGVGIRQSELPAEKSNYEIEERLLVLLEGGKRSDCTDFGRQNREHCRVQRIGAAALGSVALPPSASACTTIDFATLHGIGVNPEPNGMHAHNNEVNRYTANSVIGSLSKESSTTRELSTVNIHLTSPAASIALALMYLRTSDKFIFHKLAVPETIPEIEMIRPDVLMMRTLCALMVDYDNILPSTTYLDALVPPVIKRFVHDYEYVSPAHNEWWSQSVDMNTVAEAYYYIKTAVCLAIGIRYASTYNSEAAKTIRKFLDQLFPLGKNYFIPKLRSNTKNTLTNSCASIVVYSLSLVMAGSGDLDALRAIRQVRNHLPNHLAVESDSFIYGLQVYCNSALGILFLGNARYGFAQTNEAIAMLLISSYPILSQSICDQKHYFQPLRFMWSLATEYRHLTPVDDSSYQAVRMQAKITVTGANEPMILQLPSVLPPLCSIKKMVIYARDYKEVELDMSYPEDKAELEKVLKEYFGRFPVKKVIKPYSKIFDSPPNFKISDTFDCAPVKNDSFLVTLPLS